MATVSATAPSSPSSGDVWFKTTNTSLYVYNGTDWLIANDPYALTSVGSMSANAVSVAELAAHIRFTPSTAEEIELTQMISSATLFAEHYTGRFIINRTATQLFNSFPLKTISRDQQHIKLRGGQANSVTSVKYYDSTYTEQTLATSKYRVINKLGATYIYPAMGQDWETNLAVNETDIITVTYNIGDVPSAIPSPIRSAVLLIAASLFENRENEIIASGIVQAKPVLTAKDLLHPYKVR